ncbi:MAG TPA: glycoside hydrolase family 9 protein [Pirellulaceae bacterium]|jgi:endoglucanase|nr:glycoside hydrolase family 9 protein [Pirellulaceae bacterium]
MSFAATTLAWSAIEQPEGWTTTGQMDELLESLIHVNRYFLKCVLNPDAADPATELEVVIGCGGREGVEPPNVHAMWAPAEVAHLMTNRPTFRLNREVPGGDIPGAMAAAMAASSMVIREHADVLEGKPGYEGFAADGFADLLLDRSGKLFLFARANAGPALRDEMSDAEKEAIRATRRKALRADGAVVETGYRADPFDKLFAAAAMLQRAHLAKNPEVGTKWFDVAEALYENEYKAESNRDWWKDFGAGNLGKLGAYTMMRLAPSEEKYHAELQHYCCSFLEYGATPGGLRLREPHSHEYGSLRHANNAAVMALYYSEHVESSPPLSGNVWWKKGRSEAELKQAFADEAQRQVDYALGANPYGRSYLVGFGNQPFNHVHHRGAYGAWAGFDHFIEGKPQRRAASRHVLYGALVAGPDRKDVFLCGKERLLWAPVPGTDDHDFYYQFPNRSEPVRKETYRWDDADEPHQDVMDSKYNEVALDYNAGFTASLAWLCAHGKSAGSALPDDAFPPEVVNDESLDLLTTDREFFVAARLIAAEPDAVEIEATIWNRSRWPARATDQLAFRCYFDQEGEIGASLAEQGAARISQPQTDASGRRYVEVSWRGEMIYPGDSRSNSRTVRVKLSGQEWDRSDDWSLAPIDDETRIVERLPLYQAGERVSGSEPQ